MRIPTLPSFVSTPILVLLGITAFTAGRRTAVFDEITVQRINVVDSAGRERVILASGFGERRPNLGGLLFINQDGIEAGGLVYTGTRDSTGAIRAGAILTFDQYQNDQTMAIQYSHDGDRKWQGMTFQDRPDTLSDLVGEFYRAMEAAPDGAIRDSIRKVYLPKIQPRDLVARRLFVGRDRAASSVVTLSDPDGKPRLTLSVDSLGQARIAFLDASGQVTKTITP
jgi:hypothetical protein